MADIRRVGYVVSDELLAQTDRVHSIRHRASMVHHLIEAYGLLEKLIILPAVKAEVVDLTGFHSEDYIEVLKNASHSSSEDELEDFGLGFDCPSLSGMLNLAQTVAGGSLTGADALCLGQVDVAINWCGGWHHAQRNSASGFCYVNDIVLSIQRLRSVFDKVLYLDMDVHHGDGVQNAFYYSRKVLTVSLHHYAAGYFPGTGGPKEIGSGAGARYSLNVPLKEGVDDETFYTLVRALLKRVLPVFKPDALVCQCGADALAHDPLGAFNLTPAGMSRCVEFVLNANLPTLVLGGGGYHLANAARCWTQITAGIVGVSLSDDIPEHSHFERYGPSFEVHLNASTRRNSNSADDINDVLETIEKHACLLSSGVAPACV